MTFAYTPQWPFGAKIHLECIVLIILSICGKVSVVMRLAIGSELTHWLHYGVLILRKLV